MIKDLTKSANSKPSSLKNYTNQQLDVFINQKVDGVNETKTTGKMIIIESFRYRK